MPKQSPEMRKYHEYVENFRRLYLARGPITQFDVQKLKIAVTYVRENGGHFNNVYRGMFIEYDVPLLTKKPVVKL